MSPCFNSFSGPPVEIASTGATEVLGRKATRKAGKVRGTSLHQRVSENDDFRSGWLRRQMCETETRTQEIVKAANTSDEAKDGRRKSNRV